MGRIKNRAFFYFMLGVIAAVFTVLSVVLPGIFRVISAALGAVIAALWCFYFRSIKYAITEKYLVAESGILFRKKRKIALSDVILETRISVGKTVFLTILRTSGCSAVIFGRIDIR